MGWYFDTYLTSDHWKQIKNQAYKRNPACFCGKRYHLNFHHTWYGNVGTRKEIRDVKTVYATHHHRIHHLMNIFLLPRNEFWIFTRYYYIKWRFLIWQFIKSYIP